MLNATSSLILTYTFPSPTLFYPPHPLTPSPSQPSTNTRPLLTITSHFARADFLSAKNFYYQEFSLSLFCTQAKKKTTKTNNNKTLFKLDW
jgi:hypothetical protein